MGVFGFIGFITSFDSSVEHKRVSGLFCSFTEDNLDLFRNTLYVLDNSYRNHCDCELYDTEL